MIVFHGSEHIVAHPAFHGGKRTNDYGYGFYTTESLELAKEWACARGSNGFANRYELSLEGLSLLQLNGEGYSILNWLAILAAYRSYWQSSSIAEQAKTYLQEHFFVDPEKYDVVIGYRADDSYFSFAQDFVANAISLRQLSEAMHLGRLGEQIVLKSERAHKAIRFLGAVLAEAPYWSEQKAARDREARRAYRVARQAAAGVDEIYMLDIMREEMTHGDPRLR